MDNQISTIVCPNCGANTSNRLNCEYCGSMLVRFTEKNIAIDESKYGASASCIAGLEKELENNIKLQKLCPKNQYVYTNISDGDDFLMQVVQTNMANVGIDAPNPFPDAEKPSLSLRLPFLVRDSDDDFASIEKARLNSFQAMECFSLFTRQDYEDGVNYYINFGSDYKTAARIVSQVISEDGRNINDVWILNTVLGDASEVFVDEIGNVCAEIAASKKNVTPMKTWIGLGIVVVIILIFSLLFA